MLRPPSAAGRAAAWRLQSATGACGGWLPVCAIGVGMWQTLKDTFHEWTEDKVPRLSAALAFYTMLSIAPLLIITVKIVGMILRKKEHVDQTVTSYLSSVSSPQTADTFKQILEHSKQPGGGLIATTVSIIILLFSASGAF